jgi:hypothetical protein
MGTQNVAAYFVLVIAAAVLFYVAVNDLRQFKIPNELILVLAGLFVLHAVLSGRWSAMHWHVALAVMGFAIMLFFYAALDGSFMHPALPHHPAGRRIPACAGGAVWSGQCAAHRRRAPDSCLCTGDRSRSDRSVHAGMCFAALKRV